MHCSACFAHPCLQNIIQSSQQESARLGLLYCEWLEQFVSNKIIGMGCQAVAAVIPQATKHTLFGVLTIHLRALHLGDERAYSGKSSSLLVKMTNQSFKTKPIVGDNLSESFDFTVNSRYQRYGRSLIVEAFQEGMVSESSVGLGITDLQLIIRERKREVLKVYLNHQSKRVGWVQIEASFEQVPAFPITLLFDSALIRRKTSKFAAVKCKIRTTIGEEVLQTKVCEDKEDQPPSWRNEQLTFFVLKDKIKEGKVQILDGEVQIGHITINLQEVYCSKEPLIQLNEQFHFQEDIVAGTVKFAISKAESIQVKDSEPKKSVFVSPSKKKLPLLMLPETAEKQKPGESDRKEEIKVQHVAQNPVLDKPNQKDIDQEEKLKKEEEERKIKQMAQKAQEEAKLFKEQEEQRIKEEKQKLARQEQNRKAEERRLRQEQEKEARLKEEMRLKQLEEAKLREQAKKAKEEEEKRKQEEEKKAKEAEQARLKEQQAKKLKEEQQNKLKEEEAKKIKEQQGKKMKQEQQKKLKEEDEAKRLKLEQEKRLKEEEQNKLKQEEAKKLKEKQGEQSRRNDLERQEEQKARKMKEAEQLKKKEQEQKLARAHEEEQKRKEDEVKKLQEAKKLKQQQQSAIKQQEEQREKEEALKLKQSEENHLKEKKAAVQAHQPKAKPVEEVKEGKEQVALPKQSQKPMEQVEHQQLA